MSFGSLTPIAVRVVGTDMSMVRQHATKVATMMKRIPFLRDVQFEQTLDYPSVEVTIDREKAGLSGAKVEDVARALVMATSSTRFTNLNYWVDVKTGFDYLVQIQVPPLVMEKPEDLEILPLQSVNSLVNLMVRDVATVRKGVRAGEFDRSTSQRYLTLTANVEGEDMGRASGQVAEAIAAAGTPPRGVRVETMGQLPPMVAMFQALGIGLGVAVFVIFVLLTANFQSPRMALISIGAVPGVLAGIAIILYVTNTSLNIESFMGSIMSLGVSVSNSVLLVTFMNEHWKTGSVLDRGGHRGRGRAAAADLDDRRRDDRGHGADGAGARTGKPDAGPARVSGHRRPGDVDLRHVARAAIDFRDRDRPEGGSLAVDLPGRPGKRALRSACLRGPRPRPATTSFPADGPVRRSSSEPVGARSWTTHPCRYSTARCLRERRALMSLNLFRRSLVHIEAVDLRPSLALAGRRGRPIANRRQKSRPSRIHRLDLAGGPAVGDFGGGVAQRVEQLELCPVVFGDRGEVLVQRHLHQLE